MRIFLLSIALVISSAVSCLAHALEPAFLDIRQTGEETWQVFWRKPDVAGQPMAIGVTLPENCRPGANPTPKFDSSAWVARWFVSCRHGLAGQTLSIEGLSEQRTDVLVRLQAFNQSQATIRLTPDQDSYSIPEIPTSWAVLQTYFGLGFEHILEGWDHLLFVFALLMLIRDFWRLVGAITAFTVAHSITLALASFGHIAIPGPPVEAIIALSIVFLAIEILKSRPAQERLSERYPWLIAFAFGLLHGLGFAGALSEIGLPAQDITLALLSFNLGVEVGQLVFVVVILVLTTVFAWTLRRIVEDWYSYKANLLMSVSYGIGGIATFWLVERIMSF